MTKTSDLPKIPLSPEFMMGSTTTGQVSGWFGPLAPMKPVAPHQVAGRQFDLQPGYNLISRPRQTEPISFEQLRALADSYDLLRLIIETRKDQVDRMEWSFRAKKGKKVAATKIDAIAKFFERPNQEHSFNQWLRMILEDLFVIDAPTLWKQRNRGGELIALHPLDGGTIKRVIDNWGRTPQPYIDESGKLVTLPAYQQVLKGYPAIDYTVDQIVYSPRNVRTNRVYGYSPVEQIIMTVNIALRRQLGQLEYYTAGNIPESLIGVPDTWTPDQIKAFQDYWDLYFTGDTAARRKAKFVPGGVAKTFIQTKEPELKNIFDEWLARVCCFAFSVSSQPFVSQVNRATAGTQKEQAEEEGLVPILQWVKHLIDPIVAVELGQPDVEFVWGDDQQVEPGVEATILNSYTSNAIMTRNEARGKLGLDPVNIPEADELGFSTASGFVYLDETKKPPPPPQLLGPGMDVGDPEDPVDPKDTKKMQQDIAEKLDALFDLSKQEGHDVSDQPRDENGRFASSGGPSSRDRKKAERAASRADDGIARDENGRFTSGRITKKNIQDTAVKVGSKVAVAAALAATATVITKLASKSLVGQGISTVAKLLAKTLLVSSAETVIATALKGMGAEAEFANKAAKIVRKTAMDLFGKATGGDDDAEKMALTEELLKADDLTDEDRDLIVRMMQIILPRFTQQVINALITDASAQGADSEKLDLLETELDAIRDKFVEELSTLGKSEQVGDLKKRLRKLKPLPVDRPATRKATKAAFQTLRKGLQKAGKAAATLVAAELSDTLQRVAKASGNGSSEASRIAASLNLDAIEEIYVDLGEDLAIAAADAGHRTVIQFGASSGSELVGQVSENASRWAREHAGELLGKKILPDGSVVDDNSDGYTITQSTRDIVRDVISRGLEDGLSQEEIVDNLVEAGFSEDRAQLIAENEVANANSAGTLQGYLDAEEAGIEVKKGWITVGDEKVDGDICKANEDQGPIPVSEPFQSGHMAPLGHTNCRCSLVAYVGSDAAVSNTRES